MKNFEVFCEEVVEALKKKFPEDFVINCKTVTKNNGVVLIAVNIVNPKCNIAPAIYLESFYEMYCKGRDFDAVVEYIFSFYKKHAHKSDLDLSFFRDFSKASEKIVFKLVNTEKNKELLQDVPYVPFLDMAIVFQCVLDQVWLEPGSILIQNSHLEMWGKSVAELYELAKVNTPKLLPLQIKGVGTILDELFFDEKDCEEFSEIFEELPIPMFIISNNKRVHGAATILYENALAQFAERMQKDIIILPSSIHECILIPFNEEHDKEFLEGMVQEVNRTQVDEQEILTDRVYIYSKELNRIDFMN